MISYSAEIQLKKLKKSWQKPPWFPTVAVSGVSQNPLIKKYSFKLSTFLGITTEIFNFFQIYLQNQLKKSGFSESRKALNLKRLYLLI